MVLAFLRTRMARLRQSDSLHDDRGFGLVESLISVGVAGTGLLAVAGLLATAATLQQRSRDGGRAGMAAMQQLEVLRILPRNDARLTVGGNLFANVADHTAIVNVTPTGQMRVRWLVQAGPAGSLDITVRAQPVRGAGLQGETADAATRASQVRTLLWR
ncbi:hypothetical protein TBR22_A05470 [Luteitalea sp. TBR-22]|uniref:type IV pilus modification PilV family protein n=1 Tax=Luteitalea sp. TBR-22 TaxID=2802971 RepID=UPI001AF48029|nr:hypothetical protein [Luteitalea sp. TBR-22]BCS31347.1 hypothetical protein TBR22_A05470 [Luteitalea sp. TBR-22]